MAVTAGITTPSTVQVGNVIANPAGTPGTAGKSVELLGQWATSTLYKYRELVYNNGATYACKSAHKSASLTEPGVGANWTNVWESFASSAINDSSSGTGITYSSSKILSLLTQKADAIHNQAASTINTGTFADALVAESNVTQHVGAIDHNSLSNYDADEHRKIDDSSNGLTDLWSATKIQSYADTKAPLTHTHGVADINTGTFADALISQTAVTQHNAALDHGSMAGLGDNDHSVYPTNSIVSTLFTSPGADFGVPAQNTITGENDGQGLLKLHRSSNGTTLPTNTNVEMFPLYEGVTLIGGWIDSNGGRIGSGNHNVTAPDGSFFLFDGPIVVGPNGFLMVEDAGEVRWYERYASGDYYIGEKAPENLSSSFTYTKPVPLANADANEGAALHFVATGSERGKQEWRTNRGTAFPTTDLHEGRKFLRTDLGEEFTYHDGTAFGSPAVPIWIGSNPIPLIWGDNLKTNITGTYDLDLPGNANPGSATTGYYIPFDFIVQNGYATAGSSLAGDVRVRVGTGGTGKQGEWSMSSGKGGIVGSGMSEWVKFDACTGTDRVNCQIDYDSGANIQDPLANFVAVRFFTA